MPNTKIGTTWAPDIRPENIETFIETYTPEGGGQQTVTYKAVNHHPILNQVLDKLAFFRTHVGAVWYNLAERKTLLAKLNEMDEELRDLNAKMAYEEFDVTIASPQQASGYVKNGMAVILINLQGGATSLSFRVPSKYASKRFISGSFCPQGTEADGGKCIGVYIDRTDGYVWLKEALISTCTVTIMYPV